jgi:hypothetical protein
VNFICDGKLDPKVLWRELPEKESKLRSKKSKEGKEKRID